MNFTDITYIAESLDLGESIRAECPDCHGKDKTLSVSHTMDGTILYQCFRASCGLKGRIGGIVLQTKTEEKPKRKVWEGKTESLLPEIADWIARKWGITDPEHWYFTEDYGGRIAMSIRSPNDTHRGWVLRNDGSQMPKALTYLNEDEVALSWYIKDPCAPTVLVEDLPSAVRASTYINAIALIGTACGEDKAEEIRKHAQGPIIIALDQDATDQAMDLRKRYSLLWDNPQVLPLQQDLKDMNEATLCQLLGPYKNQS